MPYPNRASSLGSAIFGPSEGPLPFEGREDNPAPDGPPMEDVGMGSGDPYEDILLGQLKRLQNPVQVPQPEHLHAPLAAALQFTDPNMRADVLKVFERKHQAELQNFQVNEGRQSKVADISAQLAVHRQNREDRNYKANYGQEISAANASNINYPYRIPGFRDVARKNLEAKNALISQRNRSGLARIPKPKFSTKADHMAWLETQLRIRQSQLSKMYDPQNELLGETEQQKNVKSDAEADYGHLRTMRQALGKMSEDQYRRFSLLTDDEQDALMDQLNNPDAGGPIPGQIMGQDQPFQMHGAGFDEQQTPAPPPGPRR